MLLIRIILLNSFQNITSYKESYRQICLCDFYKKIASITITKFQKKTMHNTKRIQFYKNRLQWQNIFWKYYKNQLFFENLFSSLENYRISNFCSLRMKFFYISILYLLKKTSHKIGKRSLKNAKKLFLQNATKGERKNFRDWFNRFKIYCITWIMSLAEEEVCF